MKLIALDIDSIQLGQPLPFVLRGADGKLLAQRGYVIRNRQELDVLLARRASPCAWTPRSPATATAPTWRKSPRRAPP